MLSPRTVRKMVREAKKNTRTTVQGLQALVTSCVFSCSSWGQPTNSSIWSLPNIIGTMELEQGAKVRWDQNWTFCPCTPLACLVSKEGCIQGKAPHTYRQICWWIIDALGLFCWQWFRASCWDKCPNEFHQVPGHFSYWLPLPGRWDLGIGGPSNKTMTPKILQNEHRNGSVKTKYYILQWPSQCLDLTLWKTWPELKRAVHKRKP